MNLGETFDNFQKSIQEISDLSFSKLFADDLSLGEPSQLPRLATGRAAVTNDYSHRMFRCVDRSQALRPFPWPQTRRMSFTPEALYIVRSCHEQDNKKAFMSGSACAEGYRDDTPAVRSLIQQLLCDVCLY